MKTRSAKFNIEEFKKLSVELTSITPCLDEEKFLSLVGATTTGFEMCEMWMHNVLSSISTDRDFSDFVFSNINSRHARYQFAKEFLKINTGLEKPKNHTIAYGFLERWFELGKDRDAIAHSQLARWSMNNEIESLLLNASSHIKNKYVAGLPKRFYDIERLQGVVNSINDLQIDMSKYVFRNADRNLPNMKQKSNVDDINP